MDGSAPVLLFPSGKLGVVDLSQATHTSTPIGPVPSDETLEFGQALNHLAVTDIDYYQGEIFVAGGSQIDFESLDSYVLRINATDADGNTTTTQVTINVENLTAARSRILDADFAKETAELSLTQVLQQAGVSILAQANAQPQLVLSLLQ